MLHSTQKMFVILEERHQSIIDKYFNKISKKRDLSGESNPEEKRKKSNNDAAEDDLFQQVNTTNEVLEYPKTVEVKLSEIYNLSNDMRSMQIKGGKQLANLTQSVKLLSEKLDEFEKDCKEKEKNNNQFETRS